MPIPNNVLDGWKVVEIARVTNEVIGAIEVFSVSHGTMSSTSADLHR